MKDPIVDEVRRIREEHAAQFNYDIDAICEDIRRIAKSGTSVQGDVSGLCLKATVRSGENRSNPLKHPC